VAERVLLLTADQHLAESISELLDEEGLDVTTILDTGPVQAAVADLDAWPADWDIRLLRRRLGQVPCLLLSGSPFAGPYIATTLARGYFMYKPFSPRRLLTVLRRCIHGGSLGC
jgi:DNA-binding response OmpR family regulator